MKRIVCIILSGTLAAALALTGCSRPDAGSGSSSLGGSTSMSGSSGSQTAAWRTGLGVVTGTAGEDRAGKITAAAAAVLLDENGKLAGVKLDEAEFSVSADGSGEVTLPEDTRTKRQKGADYPLAAASGIGKGWAEQADFFGEYLVGRTPEQVEQLAVDENGKPKDADLLSGCTIAVERYRDAVVRACESAAVLGAAKGDAVSLGMELQGSASGNPADDDHDLTARADITLAALTLDAGGHITSAIGDMAEPALTVSADGTVSAPDKAVRTKREQGEDYGMRKASALDKEWYQHSEGYCSYLKGRTRTEVLAIPTDGSDADLAALCTISVTDLQKAVLDALNNAG